MRLSNRGCLSKRGLGGTVLMCLCTVWNRRATRVNILVRLSASEVRWLAVFPAQYAECWPTEFVGAHSEAARAAIAGREYGKEEKNRQLSFKCMLPFGLLRGPEMVLSSSFCLNTPVMCTQSALSDSSKMCAFAICTSLFQLHNSCSTNDWLTTNSCFTNLITWGFRYMIIPFTVILL